MEAHPAPGWAGPYLLAGGFESTSIHLGERGFVLDRADCLGTTEIAYGKVDVLPDGALRVTVEERFARFALDGWFPGESLELLVVRWGAERYLVPRGQMEHFSRLAAPGVSSRAVGYPRATRAGDSIFRGPDLVGLPDVPEEFRRYLPQ